MKILKRQEQKLNFELDRKGDISILSDLNRTNLKDFLLFFVYNYCNRQKKINQSELQSVISLDYVL